MAHPKGLEPPTFRTGISMNSKNFVQISIKNPHHISYGADMVHTRPSIKYQKCSQVRLASPVSICYIPYAVSKLVQVLIPAIPSAVRFFAF